MLDYNELKDEIKDTVNNTDGFFDDDQVDAIAWTINHLDGFSLQNGDTLDSVDADVFWDIVKSVDDGRDYDAPTDWRA